MSFEGMYQFLCATGHRHTRDAYDAVEFDGPHAWACETCGSAAVWWQLVDQTNGDEQPVELVAHAPERCHCSGCGNVHLLTGPNLTYHVPAGVGHHRQPDGSWKRYPDPDAELRWRMLIEVSPAELERLEQERERLRLLRKYLLSAPTEWQEHQVDARILAWGNDLDEVIAELRAVLEPGDA